MATNLRALSVASCAIITVIIAAIFVAARFYVRLGIIRLFGVEDWLVLVALIFSVGNTIGMCLQANSALGIHIQDLALQQLEKFLKEAYATIIVYNLSLAATKLSILFLYLRIIEILNLRKACYVVVAIVTLSSLWSIVSSILTCIPVSKFWDPTIDGWCLSHGVQWFANAGLNIGTDFLILSLPIPVIRSLVLSKAQKIALYFVFALGFFICIVSILRIHSLGIAAKSTDPTYENIGIAVWSTIEINTAIVCACLTTLRPLASRIFPRIFVSTSKNGYIHQRNAAGHNSIGTNQNTKVTSASHTVYNGAAAKSGSDTEILGSCSDKNYEMQDVESQHSGGGGVVTTHARLSAQHSPWEVR